MSKVSNAVGSSRVQSNLLQQNCFVRDCSKKSDLKTDYPENPTYTSLDEVTVDKGIEFRETVQPYLITPQYVSSFIDSSDYRRDPANAIANGVKRVNLGDISGFQDVSKMDMTQARALYSQLSAKFAKAGQVPAPAPAPSDNNNEVK